MPPVIQTFDPGSAASEAIGAYSETKRRNELEVAAQKYQQQQADAAAARDTEQTRQFNTRQGLEEREFADRQNQNTIANAASDANAKLEARKVADTALHQAREDALAAAKDRDARDKNNRQFVIDHLKIEQAFKAEMLKLQSAREVAEIHSSATIGAANIHAAATVQAAGIGATSRIQAEGMRESDADRRANQRDKTQRDIFGQRDSTTRRGQDVNASTRTATTNVANHRAMLNAMLRLSLSKTAPKPPSAAEDPHFAESIKRFMTFTPEQRAAAIANPNMPAGTKAYLQAIAGLVTTNPDDAPVPNPNDDEDP